MIHSNIFVSNLLISCWVVAASLVAEETNMGAAVFVVEMTTHHRILHLSRIQVTMGSQIHCMVSFLIDENLIDKCLLDECS